MSKKYHSFYLDENLIKKLQDEASEDGRSFNNYITKILENRPKSYNSKI